ncbi:unnamed protein product [Caenorhabditis bovis]|uniref:C2H2-type domain-containing protein n=1 Tax=Caenorhabditis bovis TaxID=2654633 RepID=A0A8S1ERG2_9PELO|nr:unnamed protein product [Caenorhabditis bovis]
MSLSGEYCVEDLLRGTPKYAVIAIEEQSNVVQLFKDLVTLSQRNVRFFDDLCDHPLVKERFPNGIPPLAPSAPAAPQALQALPLPIIPQYTQPCSTSPTMTMVKSTRVDMSQTFPDVSKPTTFQVQIAKKSTEKRARPKATLLNGHNSHMKAIGATAEVFARSGDSSSQNYDQTIDQVIGKAISASCDPNVLVTSLFAQKQSPTAQATLSTMTNSNKKRDDSKLGELVTCKLCESRIMATRYSNLSNHVRRHATLKQYQCPLCPYQNNEQAKVRLHMQNQHMDTTATIIDKFSAEMQEMWERLMDECFPNHQEILQTAKETRRHNETSREASMQPEMSVDMDAANMTYTTREVCIYRCIECSAVVPCMSGQEVVKNNPLEAHLRADHSNDCYPYMCDECGYQNAEQWKIRWHISLRHTNNAAECTVSQSKSPMCSLFIKKYFTEADSTIPDDEEERELQRLLSPKPSTPIVGAKRRKMLV